MPAPLNGADSARPETTQQRNFRVALDGALAAMEALRTGGNHPQLYQGAEGQQRKLAEREAARLRQVARKTAYYPPQRQDVHQENNTNPYDHVPFGGRENWRGD